MHFYNKGRDFAQELNTSFEKIFNQVLDDVSAGYRNELAFAKGLESKFLEQQEAWYRQSHAILEDNTIRDFLASLNGEDTISFLQGMAEVSDFDFPTSVEDRVRAFTPEERDKFIQIIERIDVHPSQKSLEERNREIFLLKQFLPLAKVWSDEATVQRILAWFLSAGELDDRVADAIGEYIKGAGDAVVIPVTKRIHEEIEEGTAEDNGTDYLLQALTYVAKQEEKLREDFYPVLRTAFRTFSDKQIPVICLGDLGTVRAIPLLRSYIEKNEKTISRELYYEILSSIKRLGGSTKDLPDPFQDFSPGKTDLSYLFGLED